MPATPLLRAVWSLRTRTPRGAEVVDMRLEGQMTVTFDSSADLAVALRRVAAARGEPGPASPGAGT